MASTFFERIDFLADAVGYGTLRGKVEVSQLYAHYQHEGTEFEHPQGGQAHYLRDPLFEHSNARMESLARALITPEGSDIRNGMGDAMETLSDDVHDLAPREFGNLRNSGHPTVTDDGAVIYDRPPHVPRLTEAELRSEHHRAEVARKGRRRRREFRRNQ